MAHANSFSVERTHANIVYAHVTSIFMVLVHFFVFPVIFCLLAGHWIPLIAAKPIFKIYEETRPTLLAWN